MRIAFALPALVLCCGALGCVSVYAATAPAEPPPPSPAPFMPPPPPMAIAKGPAAPAAHGGPKPPARSQAERHVYRLDYVLEDGAKGPSSNGGSYTINLEEEHAGEVHVGANVPLGAKGGQEAKPRQDVGMKIRANYAVLGEELLLQSSLELSSADDGGAIHKMTAQGDAVVAPGKRALCASLEDSRDHRRYQLFVTATKLR